MIDTHAHLYAHEFDQDIAQVVARNLDSNVRRVYLPNIDVDTIDAMLKLEAQYPDHCAAMMGIHPCHIGTDFQQQLYQVEDWLGKRKFAAIGEVGIDLYHNKTYQQAQEEALSIQLTWAKQYQLPVVIHCRGGFAEAYKVLAQHQDGSLQGIFHCFSGSAQEAARIIDLGFYLGIGGMVTFKNAGVASMVAAIGLEHLVLETDAPYLAPVPYRGQRNEPAYLLHIAEKIAELHKVDLATVARLTTDNAKRVFAED
ncbi:MAG: TatD family hydrolase [Bacteroidota bacterium]